VLLLFYYDNNGEVYSSLKCTQFTNVFFVIHIPHWTWILVFIYYIAKLITLQTVTHRNIFHCTLLNIYHIKKYFK